jgi:hypothetical protein
MTYEDSIVGEIRRLHDMHFVVRVDYDRIELLMHPGTMCHMSVYLELPEETLDLAEALTLVAEATTARERQRNVKVGDKQSICVYRNTYGDREVVMSVGRDDDYVSLYIPKITDEEAITLAGILGRAAERLEKAIEERDAANERQRQAFRR